MRIDIEHAREVLRQYREINSLAFKDIQWYEKGARLELSDELIEEYKFTGLSPIRFVDCELWDKTTH